MSTQPLEERFALTCSRGFESLLAQSKSSLAFTTYQAGKLFTIGLRPDGRLDVHERTYPRCMGLAVSADARRLLLATHFQLYRFDDALANAPATTPRNDHDALYVPRVSWITGDLDIHDVAFGADGRPLFVNTRFSCLATVSDGFSFKPIWQPRFVTRLAPEDRCHLNGLAVDNGRPRYVTAVAGCDVGDGWRDKRADGGLLIDVDTGETAVGGLSMPHSPRLHQGRLWLLNAGSGELGTADLAAGRFEPVAFCPGFSRGLAFAGNLAFVGLSLARENRTFQGLPLDGALKAKGAEARCGIIAVDVRSGDTVGWIRLEGVVRELYDIAVLPGIGRPSMLGFKSDEITRVISIDDAG